MKKISIFIIMTVISSSHAFSIKKTLKKGVKKITRSVVYLPKKSMKTLGSGLRHIGVDISSVEKKFSKLNDDLVIKTIQTVGISKKILNTLSLGVLNKVPIINQLDKELSQILIDQEESVIKQVDYKKQIQDRIDDLQKIKKDLMNNNDLYNVTHGIAAFFTRTLYNNEHNYDELSDFNDLVPTYFILSNTYTQFTGVPFSFDKYATAECFKKLPVNKWVDNKKNIGPDKISKGDAFSSVYECLFSNVSQVDFIERHNVSGHYYRLMKDESKREIFNILEKRVHVYSNYNKKLTKTIDNIIIGYKNITRKTQLIIQRQEELREKYENAKELLDELRD